MWKPPERIKYDPAPGQWPTAEEAAGSKWFTPVDIGPITLAQRTWVPAMVPWRASEDGFVTDDVLAWYERFAQGRPGAVVVEATGIRDIPSGPLLRIGHDRFIPGLTELADTVHRASDGQTRLLIQCIDFLSIKRRPDPAKFLSRFLQIDDAIRENLNAKDWSEEEIREHLVALPDEALDGILNPRDLESLRMGYRERVDDLHLDHIRDIPKFLPDLFADASERAQKAGLDGVELHYAHAYTMASFLSRNNNRDDGYGGSPEARARLPLEVFARVRERVGDDYPLGCRFLAEECVDGGSELEDSCYYAVEFAKAGMDFLSLSRGGRFEDAKQPGVGQAAYPYTGRSGYECMPAYLSDEFGPYGRNIEPGRQIKAAVREAGFETPIVVTGGVHGFEMAEAMLQRGDADIVGSARQALADPDWFLKASLGKGEEVRVCEFTNYCEGLDQKHKMVTCKLWDKLEKGAPTTGIPLTNDGKRRSIAPVWENAPGSK